MYKIKKNLNFYIKFNLNIIKISYIKFKNKYLFIIYYLKKI